jgi:hypothetical protein
MAVAEHNFEWYQGHDLSFDVFYAVDGEAQDLTGYKARMDIAPFGSDGSFGTPVLTLNSDDADGPSEMTLDDNGKITVNLDRSHTIDELNVGTGTVLVFAYDLFLRKPDGKQLPIMRGTITLQRAVTVWE